MVLPVINIGSKLDGKGFKQALTASEKLGKSVKNLAGSFGLAFGAAGLLSYGKNAVKAFAENEKSAKRLETVLKNIGLGFDTAAIEKNLGDISAKFGYEGEVLRESFQKLITVTGDTAKATDLLNLSLDIAAGSGESLATVNADLAAVYVGNTKGLRKYNLGLTQTELKTLDVNDAVKLLSRTFGGAGEAELKTFSGQMRVLREAADNAQETIGTGLVTAFGILSGEEGIGKATTAMEDFSESIKFALIGLAELTSFKAPSGQKSLFGLLLTPIKRQLEAGPLGALIRLGERTAIKPKPFGTPMSVSGSTDVQGKIERDRAKAAAEAARREKERLALIKKQALAEKNKLSLSKAAAEFDTNRISIAAALKNTYDKETRLRLEALMAIEDEDGDKALDRIKQLGLLTEANQTAKLNGLKGITEKELESLNTILMKELSAIESAKNAKLAAIDKSGADQASKDAAKLKAIADAEAAEAAAFAKYNDALAKQGGLNDLDFYTKKTQITTLEVLRLASINKTTAAQTLADQLALAAGVKTVEEIAAKRKAAQDADNAAMAAEAAARKAAEDKAFTDYLAALKAKNDAALIADADLTAAKLASISSVAAAQAAADAAALSGVAAISSAIKSIPPYPTWTPPPAASIPDLPSMRDPEGNFPDFGGGLYIDPSLVNPGGSNNNYTVTVNAGAIASQDEFTALLQDTIQRLNRNGDPLTTAGIA
jgi:hypothetical protein